MGGRTVVGCRGVIRRVSYHNLFLFKQRRVCNGARDGLASELVQGGLQEFGNDSECCKLWAGLQLCLTLKMPCKVFRKRSPSFGEEVALEEVSGQ